MESRIHVFDTLGCSLTGTHLIEASAGTGKTFAISRLYLRQLLEKGLSVGSILVVTYTEASTAELRVRIRGLIGEALRVLETGECEDESLRGILDKADPQRARDQLILALRSFDEAAIFTIHGFCRRVLQQHAFESGVRFDVELVTDGEKLLKEAAGDFWRTHFYQASPYLVNYALRRGYSPSSLLRLVPTHLIQPGLNVLPQLKPKDSAREEPVFERAFCAMSHEWPAVREEIGELLLCPALNKSRYRESTVRRLLSEMEWFRNHGRYTVDLFEDFEKFTPGTIESATKMGQTAHRHRFFDLCDEVLRASETLKDVLSTELVRKSVLFVTSLTRELREKKLQHNVRTFDDLLTALHEVVCGPRRDVLVREVNRSFGAALIDEFQDTDPLQYEIFSTLFPGRNGSLFLIGDPKQAIYGFRGADIFTYIAAARAARRRHTLQVNYRSRPELVSAVNTLFSSAVNPFLFEKDIPFRPVSSPEKPPAEPLVLDSTEVAPMTIWFADSHRFTDGEGPIPKAVASVEIERATASRIAGILSRAAIGRARIGDSPVRASDIAVLVDKRSEARSMKRALTHLGVPAVLQSAGNLFESPQAEEMLRVLAAVADPHDQRLVRAALCTEMIGLDANDLDEALRDESAYEELWREFHEYRYTWEEHGFSRMLSDLTRHRRVLENQLRLPDGERAVTNMQHLGEILQAESVRQEQGISRLVRRLEELIDSGNSSEQEHDLRLESDEDAVRIITIHKSKGLQFPIVFCPFLWRTARVRGNTITYHVAESGRIVYDIGSETIDEFRHKAEHEQLAENLRLLYVALTRARTHCCITWGRFKDTFSSAPAYLFHRPSELDMEKPVASVEAHLKSLSDSDVRNDLERLAGASGNAIQIEPLPDDEAVESRSVISEGAPLQCRSFTGGFGRPWKIASFTSLVVGGAEEPEPVDRDAVGTSSAPVDEDTGKRTIFDFPAGASAGSFLHEILEELDFTTPESPETRELVTEKLSKYGFENEWTDTLMNTLKTLTGARIPGVFGGFTLKDIPKEDRLNEMEFHFPLGYTTPESLSVLFRGMAPDANRSPEELFRTLRFQPCEGLVRGFIDCVFLYEGRYYLVDWKSNHLGRRIEDYAPIHLKEAMERHFYTLQYHLYTVALHRYLIHRLPGYEYDRHFGGALYVFLRGVSEDSDGDTGFFYDRPDREKVGRIWEGLTGDG